MSSSATHIVVVNHNSGKMLAHCLAALQHQSTKVTIVDNASTDGSAAIKTAGNVQWLRNDCNLGFGVACNQGAAAQESEFLLILNPDTDPPVHLVEQLEAVMRKAPDVGVLGARVCNTDGSEQAATRRRFPDIKAAIARFVPFLHVESALPKAVNGSVMMIRRRVFEAVGGFDPGFFLHCEDLDLQWRILKAGYQIAIAEDVQVIHSKGGSSRSPLFVQWHKHRSFARYFRKHLQTKGVAGGAVAAGVQIAIFAHYIFMIPLYTLQGVTRG